ncbi:hypothetical protein pb186bvf_011506 [Paramecium bursaria]
MDSFIFVMTSIVDSQQRTYPGYQMVVTILFLLFMERLSLLWPHDQYGYELTSDTYEHILKQFIAPFSFTSMLFAARNDTLNTIFVYIALISVYLFTFALVFLSFAYKFKYYSPITPFGIYKYIQSVVYVIMMYIEYLIFIPLSKLLLGAVVCGENSLYISNQCPFYLMIPTYVAIALVMFYVTISQFFFRSYQIDPLNKLKRKFIEFQLIVPFTSLLLMCVDFLYHSKTNIVIRLISANLQGICWAYKVYYYNPFIRPYNKYAFLFATQYQTQVIIFCIMLITDLRFIQINQLFYTQIIFGTLMWYLCQKIYELKIWGLIKQTDFKSQYQVLYMIQNLQYLDEFFHIEKQIQMQWYYCIINHMGSCQNKPCVIAQANIVKEGVQNQKQLSNIFMNCLLTNAIAQQQSTKSDHEFLQLTLIWFQALQCQQELPAFLTLRKYQMQSKNHSFYFKCISDSMHEWLKGLIIKKQKQKQFIVQDEHDYKELTVQDIYNCQRYDEIFLPKFKEVIDQKIRFWEKLLIGFGNVNELQAQVIRLSVMMLNLTKLLEKEFQRELNSIDPNSNYYPYTIQPFYNDLQNSVQLEIQAEEILSAERSIGQQFVTNTTLINSKVVLMHIQTIRNRGNFMHNSSLNTFFGYSSSMFDQIYNINQLMPDFIKKRHPAILERYLSIGISDRFITSRAVYIKKQNGFLMAANIRINNFFMSKDDYILSASFNKIKEGCDYFLFSQKGKIIGITEGIFQQIQQVCGQINLNQFLEIANVFVLFPDLLKVLVNSKEELIWNDKEQIQLEYKTNLRLSDDLMSELTRFSQYKSNKLNSYRSEKSHRIDQEYLRAISNNQFIPTDNKNDPEYNDSCHLLGCYVALMEHNFGELMNEFIKSLTSTANFIRVSYFIKYKILGNGENSYPYFYLEINDFKTTNYTKTTYDTQQQYVTEIHKTIKFSTEEESQAYPSFVSKNEATYHPEDVDVISDGVKFKLDLHMQQNNDIYRFQEDHDILKQIDSYRTGPGPVSRRALFDNPLTIERKILGEEIFEIDKEFKDIIDLSNNASVERLNKNKDFEQFEVNENSGQHLESSKKIDPSRQIVIQRNEIDQENNRSQISMVSTTSNTRETTNLIRSIKHNKQLNGNLKVITFITLFGISLLLISVIVKIQAVNSYTSIQIIDINNIVQPYNLKGRFNKIQTMGWHFFLEYYQFIETSEFMKKDYQKPAFQLAFDVFIVLENEGLVDRFDIFFLQQETQRNQLFSNYFFLIREKYNGVLEGIQNNHIDQYFISSLFFMKYNAEGEFKVINQLLDSIFAEFITILDQKKELNLILFLIFLFSCTATVVCQIQFWIRIQQFKQRILVNMVRITEKQAFSQLMKYNLLRELLNKNTQYDWRRVDYYRIIYYPWQEIDVKSYNIDVEALNKNIITKSDKVRKQTVLTSQISNSKLSLFKESLATILLLILIFSFLFGGYFYQYQLDDNQTPTQTLTLNFIHSSLLFEEQILCALMARIEWIVMPFIKTLKNGTDYPYQNLEPNKTGYFVESLNKTNQRQSFDIKSIYDSIINGHEIPNDIEKLILDLYQNDLCLHLSNEIEFCNLDKLGRNLFIQKYGSYLDKDNNINNLKNGIVGEYTILYNLISESFGHELQTGLYIQDQQLLLDFLNSKDYLSSIIQHFLNNNKAHSLFIQKLVMATISLLEQSQNSITIFYLTFGISLIVLIRSAESAYGSFNRFAIQIITQNN